MANIGAEVERRAGIDMVPAGEFEWNPEPDEAAPILRYDLLNLSKQVAIPVFVTDDGGESCTGTR